MIETPRFDGVEQGRHEEPWQREARLAERERRFAGGDRPQGKRGLVEYGARLVVFGATAYVLVWLLIAALVVFAFMFGGPMD